MTGRRIVVGTLVLAVLAAWMAWTLLPGAGDGARNDEARQTARASDAPAQDARERGDPPEPPPDAVLPSEALPLAQRLPALEALALAGNPEAACRLAVERIRCARLKRWQPDGFDRSREDRLEAEGKLDQANDVANDSLLRIQQKSDCEAAGAGDDPDLLSLLAPAAAAGHGPAAVLYFEAGSNLHDQRGIYQHPGFDAWRRNAARQLQAALDAGVPEASRSLLKAYAMDGDFASGLIGDDPARTWFHLVLSSQLFGTTIHPRTAARINLPEAERVRIAAEATTFRRDRFGERVFAGRALDAWGITRQPGSTASATCGPPISL
ncbi:MAG: hypothetical protein ABS41_02065 [Arenimonas sp. SCN 70-307]|uniref:hypothetical protein n=1 Tax=Arenimonas sp. SCN 70-307 TaxID=1660089 RepID=UPI00086B5D2A|nr:hypothetical protein [Arenimonas sp. SCN 70-307]ODS64504.1 MAG: hypothetical protein ABS41_02065 [Arenimonas sp. SCN 70-307]